MSVPIWDADSGMFKRTSRGQVILGPPKAPEPCWHCGVLTGRIVMGYLHERTAHPKDARPPEISPGSIGYRLWPAFYARYHICEACEERRLLGQAERIAKNEAVYPRLREASRVYAAELRAKGVTPLGAWSAPEPQASSGQ